MRLPVVRLLLSVCALLAVVPAAANAATTPPKVTSVAPLKLKIGDRLTIRGKGFLAGKNRNTVLFKATGSRAVFVKAETATTTKLVVKVPAKLLAFLKVKSGQSVATTFQLRVLAKRLSPAYTPTKELADDRAGRHHRRGPGGAGAKVGRGRHVDGGHGRRHGARRVDDAAPSPTATATGSPMRPTRTTTTTC